MLTWVQQARVAPERVPTRVRWPTCRTQVKCCLLLLDIDGADELVCHLFNTLLDAVKCVWAPVARRLRAE